jgi:hypothetical protein
LSRNNRNNKPQASEKINAFGNKFSMWKRTQKC